jgi:RNA polymerase sigma-70 factor (ECF subfamily)
MELAQDFAQEVQQSWHRFLQRTESLRPDLHRYCRSLAGTVWDAEDLVQDTLLRAFAKLGDMQPQVENPKAYLFRIASNLWVDRFRRTEPAMAAERPSTNPGERSLEIRDAAKRVLQLLPPQERAAVILKDVFDFRLEEIASMLETTVGAIKAALHRGREKLAAPGNPRITAPASKALLDQFVEAFNACDLERLTALLHADVIGEVLSMSTARGKAAASGALYYCLFLEKGEPRIEARPYLNEPLLLIWYANLKHPGTRVVRDIVRIEELDGKVGRLSFYSFCPETMAEIAGALGVPLERNGYGVWSPEFLSVQKQEEFQQWAAQGMPVP